MQLGKDEILTRYLNSVYLGNGAYGMPAAARLYFDKRLSALTLPEAAMLAGLVRSPSRDNPVPRPIPLCRISRARHCQRARGLPIGPRERPLRSSVPET
jgi:membrane peptidoglycan carboxypeptidase